MKFSLKNAYKRLEKDTYSVIKSVAYGDIQYKIINHTGIPVLIVHGICGGNDQGIDTGIGLLPEKTINFTGKNAHGQFENSKFLFSTFQIHAI